MWAGHSGGGCWVFNKVDGRALFDALFVRAKALVLLVYDGKALNGSALLAELAGFG